MSECFTREKKKKLVWCTTASLSEADDEKRMFILEMESPQPPPFIVGIRLLVRLYRYLFF